MKSSHIQIIMGDFATLVQKDKFAQLSVRADNLHATSTIQNPVKEILWSRKGSPSTKQPGAARVRKKLLWLPRLPQRTLW